MFSVNMPMLKSLGVRKFEKAFDLCFQFCLCILRAVSASAIVRLAACVWKYAGADLAGRGT